MEYRPLGRTDLKVSALCLGTMTWGEQNSEQDAFAQIARAKAAGINFMDTAEMYPVPPRAETYASTERIIGNWFRRSGDRADWILASKIAGPGNGISHVRDGNLKFNRQHIVAALDASLERLQTDWLDLYQLHWPGGGPTSSASSATSTRKRASHRWRKPWKCSTSRCAPARSATSACPTRRPGAP